MAIPLIPAMTGSEIENCTVLPPKIAWLACRFSANNAGITNIPPNLPKNAMVILTDECPYDDHDADRIIHQLAALQPAEILLDFQRPPTDRTAVFTRALVQALPCPVGVPPSYAEGLTCPVFLPPVPPCVSLNEYILPWKNRTLFLELALDAVQITVTVDGSQTQTIPFAKPAEHPHKDDELHCHYYIQEEPDSLYFYLYRTREDVFDLLKNENFPNVQYALALYQELG